MRSLLIILILLSTLPFKAFSDDQIKVGIISPYSGPYSHFGDAGNVGIDLALKELKDPKIKFFYEDSKFEANLALNAAMKLIQVDKVEILVVLGTPTSNAVLPYSESLNIPTFIWSASSELSKKHKNSIRLMSTGAEQGLKIASEVIKLGYKKVALVASENGYSKAVIDGVVNSNVNFVPYSNKFYSPEHSDFNLDISKIKNAKVDAIGICLNTGQIPVFIKQLYSHGYKGGLFGCNAMSSPDVLKSLSEYGMEAWSAEGKLDKTFIENFLIHSPDTSGIWEAAGYYDMVKFINLQSPKEMIGKCIDQSAFGKSCIRKNEAGKFLQYSLGITKMKDMKFIRE